MDFWTPIFCDKKGNRFVLTYEEFMLPTPAAAGMMGFEVAPRVWQQTKAQYTFDVLHAQSDQKQRVVTGTLTAASGKEISVAIIEGPMFDAKRNKKVILE